MLGLSCQVNVIMIKYIAQPVFCTLLLCELFDIPYMACNGYISFYGALLAAWSIRRIVVSKYFHIP